MRERPADHGSCAVPRRGRLVPAGLAALVVLLLAAVIAGAAAPSARAVYRSGDDWRHVQAVVAALKKKPPSNPVVILLGGSAARECITTEPRWRAQIAACGGGRVRAYNLGSSSQSYKNDVKIVRALPPVRIVVLIGVNVGRYTSIPPQWIDDPPAAEARAGSTYDSHRFRSGDQLSNSGKRVMVRTWMREKYPRFKTHYAGNAKTLRALIELCQERGFYPVLVELPLNLRVVGRSWNAPRRRYRRDCRAAAKAYRIPYPDFVAKIRLRNGDFVDLSHLVESGRAKYQRRLSRLVVSKLNRYITDPT